MVINKLYGIGRSFSMYGINMEITSRKCVIGTGTTTKGKQTGSLTSKEKRKLCEEGQGQLGTGTASDRDSEGQGQRETGTARDRDSEGQGQRHGKGQGQDYY